MGTGMERGPAPTDIQHLLARWLASARIYGAAHRQEAARYERCHYRLGVPSTVLGAVVGTTIFGAIERAAANWPFKVALGVVSMLAASLAAVLTFMRYLERSGQHHAANAEYDNIARAIDKLSTDAKSRREWSRALDGLAQRLDALQARAPILTMHERLQVSVEKLAAELAATVTASIWEAKERRPQEEEVRFAPPEEVAQAAPDAKIRAAQPPGHAQYQSIPRQDQAVVAQLVGAATHELNPPLTTVMAYAELLKLRLEPETGAYAAAEAIFNEADRMAEIVRKIAKITKYETQFLAGRERILDLDRSAPHEVVTESYGKQVGARDTVAAEAPLDQTQPMGGVGDGSGLPGSAPTSTFDASFAAQLRAFEDHADWEEGG